MLVSALDLVACLAVCPAQAMVDDGGRLLTTAVALNTPMFSSSLCLRLSTFGERCKDHSRFKGLLAEMAGAFKRKSAQDLSAMPWFVKVGSFNNCCCAAWLPADMTQQYTLVAPNC